tara:strand:+ start:7251 stop:7691 length:441 start_codon:yes stop_codon:yes gene_type:complete
MVGRAEAIGGRGLSAAVRAFCIVPLATGIGDIAQGAKFLATAGAALPSAALSDPTLNSQLMFAGAIWLGYAPLIWYASCDLRERLLLLRLLFGFVFLSGLARTLAYLRYGSPGFVLTAAIAIELVVPPVIMFWTAIADARLRNRSA